MSDRCCSQTVIGNFYSGGMLFVNQTTFHRLDSSFFIDGVSRLFLGPCLKRNDSRRDSRRFCCENLKMGGIGGLHPVLRILVPAAPGPADRTIRNLPVLQNGMSDCRSFR